jgi:hypothetical protein
VTKCGNVGKVAAVGLIGCYGVHNFLGGAQFLQSFNNGCSQEIWLCIRRKVAPRAIEERFLYSARNDRSGLVGLVIDQDQMSGFARRYGTRERFKQQIPHPPGKSGGIRNDMSF